MNRNTIEYKQNYVLDRMYVDVTTGCWNCTNAKITNGYASACVNNYLTVAHRIAYEGFVGPIPDGLQIHHRCFNKICCNPGHLELVTLAENRRKEDCAKLNWPAVLSIRRLYATGDYSQRGLGDMFGVSRRNINHIVNRKTWNNI